MDLSRPNLQGPSPKGPSNSHRATWAARPTHNPENRLTTDNVSSLSLPLRLDSELKTQLLPKSLAAAAADDDDMGPTTATDAGARMKPTTVASAVHRVQMALYDGAAASREPLLRAAASLLSGPDYADVVTERSIADACGYPACPTRSPRRTPAARRRRGSASRSGSTACTTSRRPASSAPSAASSPPPPSGRRSRPTAPSASRPTGSTPSSRSSRAVVVVVVTVGWR